MNELDLTPFKVKFDREITFLDIYEGDIVLLDDNKLYLFPEQVFIDTGDDTFPSNSIQGIDLLDGHLIWHFSEKNIRAIYRINKFKY